MSSLKSKIQTHTRLTNVTPLGLLLGLTLINVVAFVVCGVASPWSESSTAAGVIWLLSAIPLGTLQFLSVVIYLTQNRIRRELAKDQEQSENALLTSRAGRLNKEMRDVREASDILRHSERTGSAVSAETLRISNPDGKSNLTRTMEIYVLQRYVAGEGLRLDEVDKYLHEAALDRVQPLQRDHELAFLIGLAGTVLGLVVQISLTQSSILSGTFLTGVVVKGCSTLVGIFVALYARYLRQSLLEDYDALVANLIQFASFYLAPFFVTNAQADVAEVLRRTLDELRSTVDRIKTNLSDALTLAVDTASTALGKRLKDTFATELADAIKEQITNPFHLEVERLKLAISQSGDSIAEGVRSLNEGTREFKEEFSTLARGSSSMGKEITDAGNVLKEVAHKFEEIVTQADRVTQKLKDSEGELTIAVESSQNSHSNHNGGWLRGELEKLFEDNRKDRQVYADMFDRLAGELQKTKRRGS